MRRSHPASGTEDKLLRRTRCVAAALIVVAIGGIAFAQGAGDPTAVKSEDGKYFDKNDSPSYNISENGKVESEAKAEVALRPAGQVAHEWSRSGHLGVVRRCQPRSARRRIPALARAGA